MILMLYERLQDLKEIMIWCVYRPDSTHSTKMDATGELGQGTEKFSG